MESGNLRNIIRHRLGVRDPGALSDFYCAMMGMSQFGTRDHPLLGYSADQCLLDLNGPASCPYEASSTDLYWKIGITVHDLDHAVRYLNNEGWSASEPQQFLDIGYLCHLRDPEGFTIELLQHRFKGRQQDPGRGHPIGGQATLAHVTLRVTDIKTALHDCCHKLGLELLSIQPVPQHKFCLYFLAGMSETPPNSDLESIENREWLWARPYAVLELQHLLNRSLIVRDPATNSPGFLGIAIADESGRHQQSLDAAEAYEWCLSEDA